MKLASILLSCATLKGAVAMKQIAKGGDMYDDAATAPKIYYGPCETTAAFAAGAGIYYFGAESA